MKNCLTLPDINQKKDISYSLGFLFESTRVILKKYYSSGELDFILRTLFSSLLKIDFDKVKISLDKIVDKEYNDFVFSAIVKLKNRMPIQYILEEAWFCGLSFYVNKHVLVPRPETEEIISIVESNNVVGIKSDINVLDIGTGSGCIAVAMKKKYPDLKIQAIDISQCALEVARKNAVRHKTSIEFFRYDFLKTLKFKKLFTNFDLIISNPPYVMVDEKLDIGVKKYEPFRAIFVPEIDPLIFFKKLKFFADEFLSEGGVLITELNPIFFDGVYNIFSDCKSFSSIECRKDFNNLNRFLFVKK